MKRTLILLTLLITVLSVQAQQKPDTVIVELANTSQVMFTIKDRKDLAILRQYDFQALFTDILNKLENTTAVVQPEPSPVMPDEPKETERAYEEVIWGDDNNSDNDRNWNRSNQRSIKITRKTRNSFNFDLGTNNYLSNGKFPDDTDELYAVRPWGSWYLGLNSTNRTHVGGKLFVEWGVGLSWYNFKFQKDNILITKDENGVNFKEDPRDPRDVNFIKSKLTASYVNASFIPMLDFGGRGKKSRMWHSYGSNFRIGAGPYAGYRIGSHSKMVYKEDGREKDKDRNNYYLNNFRYGIRAQIGIRSTDIFFNYDLNDLFSTDKPNNPKLNAFSFGFIF